MNKIILRKVDCVKSTFFFREKQEQRLSSGLNKKEIYSTFYFKSLIRHWARKATATMR